MAVSAAIRRLAGKRWWAPLALAAAAVLPVGCVVPPVVSASPQGGFTLATSAYPLSAEIVEVPRGEGRVLRGLWVPSDDGAPIVVHFAESGGSIARTTHARLQYEALMHAGFASLAIDYGGVGLSGGDVSTAEFVEDVRAIYARALERAGGDESRLVLRGTSLGTIAIAQLIEDGARPAGISLHAPVRASNVAVRYGYATLFDPLIWLARPFLRSFASADLLAVVGSTSLPVFVSAHPKDELLRGSDHARLVELGADRQGVTVVQPDWIRLYAHSNDASVRQLKFHVGLSLRSFDVSEDERSFFRALFPNVPPTKERALLAMGGQPSLPFVEPNPDRSMIEALYDAGPEIHDRLDQILSMFYGIRPEVAVAAACELESPGAALHWLRANWGARRFGEDPFEGRSFDDLRAVFDVADPTGDLDVRKIDRIASVLPPIDGPDGERAWSVEVVLALVNATFLIIDGERIFPTGTAPGVYFTVDADGSSVMVRRGMDGSEWRVPLHLGLMLVVAKDRDERLQSDRRRRFTRSMLKACGHAHEVLPDGKGGYVLRVPVNGGERTLRFGT